MDNSAGKRPPEALANLLAAYLKDSGLEKRVAQAEVIPGWAASVGDKIAQVTQPLFVTKEGVLFVAVQNHSWMSELQLMEPELLKALNGRSEKKELLITRLRFQLLRSDSTRNFR